MKRNLQSSNVDIGPVNRKSWLVLLATTALSPIPDVKVRDVVAKKENKNGVELSSASRNVYRHI